MVVLLLTTLFVTSKHDVIFTFAKQRFGEVCWHNLHIQGHWSRSSGTAGEAVKELRAMETYKQQNNRYQLCFFLFINNADLKNITEIIKMILNFLGAWIAVINLFHVNLDKPWNYQWYCYEKAPPPPLLPIERAKAQCPRHASILWHTCAYLHALSLLVVVGLNVSLQWT